MITSAKDETRIKSSSWEASRLSYTNASNSYGLKGIVGLCACWTLQPQESLEELIGTIYTN